MEGKDNKLKNSDIFKSQKIRNNLFYLVPKDQQAKLKNRFSGIGNAYTEFDKLEKLKQHKRAVSLDYKNNVTEEIPPLICDSNVKESTNIAFPEAFNDSPHIEVPECEEIDNSRARTKLLRISGGSRPIVQPIKPLHRRTNSNFNYTESQGELLSAKEAKSISMRLYNSGIGNSTAKKALRRNLSLRRPNVLRSSSHTNFSKTICNHRG